MYMLIKRKVWKIIIAGVLLKDFTTVESGLASFSYTPRVYQNGARMATNGQTNPVFGLFWTISFTKTVCVAATRPERIDQNHIYYISVDLFDH
jgi:hypothetical protein